MKHTSRVGDQSALRQRFGTTTLEFVDDDPAEEAAQLPVIRSALAHTTSKGAELALADISLVESGQGPATLQVIIGDLDSEATVDPTQLAGLYMGAMEAAETRGWSAAHLELIVSERPEISVARSMVRLVDSAVRRGVLPAPLTLRVSCSGVPPRDLMALCSECAAHLGVRPDESPDAEPVTWTERAKGWPSDVEAAARGLDSHPKEPLMAALALWEALAESPERFPEVRQHHRFLLGRV